MGASLSPPLLEGNMEAILAKHPELIEEGLTLLGGQVSVSGLRKLGRLPKRSFNNGEFYFRMTAVLNKLKRELGTNLIILDGFMWYVDKYCWEHMKRRRT